MVIQALGLNSFRIDSGERSILVNPPSGRFKADITLITEAKESDIVAGFGEKREEESVVITTPGEFESGGIEVRGVSTPDSDEKIAKTAYFVKWEEIKLLVFASAAIPDAEALEDLDAPDVALLAVGGEGLPAEKARELVKKLEPKIVGLASAGKTKEFLSTLGQKGEIAEKLVFKRKDIEDEKGRVVILSVQ